jgi:hypothetical protein
MYCRRNTYTAQTFKKRRGVSYKIQIKATFYAYDLDFSKNWSFESEHHSLISLYCLNIIHES